MSRKLVDLIEAYDEAFRVAASAMACAEDSPLHSAAYAEHDRTATRMEEAARELDDAIEGLGLAAVRHRGRIYVASSAETFGANPLRVLAEEPREASWIDDEAASRQTRPLPVTFSAEQWASIAAALEELQPGMEEAIRRLREAEKVSPEVMRHQITI